MSFDLSSGRERVPVPLEGSAVDLASLQTRFHEYVESSVIHPSYWKDKSLFASSSTGQDGAEDSDDDEDGEEYRGCSCSPGIALTSASESDSPLLCTSGDCECVSQHGNFYLRNQDGPPVIALDAIPPSHLLVECRPSCACRRKRSTSGKAVCANSVVASGLGLSLEVRPTNPDPSVLSSGLGLWARAPIRRGTFVCIYGGEVIGTTEAERRWTAQSESGSSNYILTLQEESTSGSGKSLRTHIDPAGRGNVARFINHLCPPLTNLVIMPVRCDEPLAVPLIYASPSSPSRIPAPPRAALFASRDIKAGEQLGFDYAEAGGGASETQSPSSDAIDRTPCLCGSPQCRRWLPFHPSLSRADIRDR